MGEEVAEDKEEVVVTTEATPEEVEAEAVNWAPATPKPLKGHAISTINLARNLGHVLTVKTVP